MIPKPFSNKLNVEGLIGILRINSKSLPQLQPSCYCCLNCDILRNLAL